MQKLYYKENASDFVIKTKKYDSMIIERIKKDILKEYYMNDLKYYLLIQGYTNFELEEE